MTTMAAEVPQLTVISAAISVAAQVIKRLILARISELGDQFPTMRFATEYDRWVSSDAVGDHPVHKTDTLPGIPLTSRGWRTDTRPYMVVLTPRGIFKYPYISGDAGRPFPHFQAGIENDRLWTQFGEYAFSLLYPRPVTTVMPDRDTAGLIANIGQEYCRYCQCVAPASEFRMENHCPKCGTDSWLAQYGIEAD